MEVILTKECESLTGSIGSGFGYYIHQRHNRQGDTRFYGVRQAKGAVPRDGHWRFIVACAQLAKGSPYIEDIRVSRSELREALIEARAFIAAENLRREMYSAKDVWNLKTTFGL